MSRKWALWMPAVLLLAVMVSAVTVVVAKHENRARVTALDQMRRERDRLEMEWAQLQIEEATLGHHARVNRIAREQLDMLEPEHQVIVPLGVSR
jgi:cell division protein FtsL